MEELGRDLVARMLSKGEIGAGPTEQPHAMLPVVDHVVQMLTPTMPRDVALRVEAGAASADMAVRMTPIEMQQVVLQVRQGSLYGNGEAGLFGGGMQAFGPQGREGDGDLLTALQRELREETGVVIDQAAIGRAPLWWATEHCVGDRLTGSLQFNRYGVPVTADTLDRLLDLQRQQSLEEGGILVLDVRGLADWLTGQQPGPAPGVGTRLGLSAWLKNPPA